MFRKRGDDLDMGVYVKDLQIPGCCFQCNFRSSGSRCLAADKVLSVEELELSYQEKPEWCPIVDIEIGE